MSFMSGKTQEIGNFDKTEGIFPKRWEFPDSECQRSECVCQVSLAYMEYHQIMDTLAQGKSLVRQGKNMENTGNPKMKFE